MNHFSQRNPSAGNSEIWFTYLETDMSASIQSQANVLVMLNIDYGAIIVSHDNPDYDI